MIKFLIVVAILFFVGRWYARRSFRRFFTNLNQRMNTPPSSTTSDFSENQTGTEVLRSCPNCGTYFSEKQGIRHASLIFCSHECKTQS